VGYLLVFEAPATLTESLALMAGSVVAWKLPVAVRAALDTFPRDARSAEEAALSLGARPWRVFAGILAPRLAGRARSIFVYFFVNGMVTVSTVILLAPPGLEPATVAVLDHVLHGARGVACALATIVTGLTAGVVLLHLAVRRRESVALLFP
jgi:iron(III) transport system permease protein